LPAGQGWASGVGSQFGSILPGGTATGSASDFGQDPGQPGKSQPLHLMRALQAKQRRAEKRKLIRRQTKVQTVGPLARNRGFESTSLQRRVRCKPISPAGGAERPLARLCAAASSKQCSTAIARTSSIRCSTAPSTCVAARNRLPAASDHKVRLPTGPRNTRNLTARPNATFQPLT
jgi:hypothetical protein